MAQTDGNKRDALAREKHAKEARTKDSRDKEPRGHHGSNRRREGVPSRGSDTYAIGDKRVGEYEFDHQSRHGARSSLRPSGFDEEIEQKEHVARLRRLEALSHSYSQPVDQTRGSGHTTRPAGGSCTREKHDRQADAWKRNARAADERGSGSHPASYLRRRSDSYGRENGYGEEHADDYAPLRRSRRPYHNDTENSNDTKVYPEHVHRSHHNNQQALSTARQTPDSSSAAAPSKSRQTLPLQSNTPPRARQGRHPQPPRRAEAPRPKPSSDIPPAYHRKYRAPYVEEDFAADP